MTKDYSNQILQKAVFRNGDLSNSNFSGTDLRGADFSGANLSGADFTHARTGITTTNAVLIFLAAFVVSLFSGYIAMLAGQNIQHMILSEDSYVKASGIITLVVTIVFIFYSYWKGGSIAIRTLLLPVGIIALAIGLTSYLTGIGTGMGMAYLAITVSLVTIMFIVGTISRAAAGTLSSTILFIIVAMGGGMFGKSIGGGIGTVIMAISCALISKKALSGAKGFDLLQKIAASITQRYGTSFRNASLAAADFSDAKIQNADFSGADVSSVKWGDSKKMNCIASDHRFTAKG